MTSSDASATEWRTASVVTGFDDWETWVFSDHSSLLCLCVKSVESYSNKHSLLNTSSLLVCKSDREIGPGGFKETQTGEIMADHF